MSDIIAVELISKKKDRCASSLQVLARGSSHTPVFLNPIRHANPFLKYTDVRGPPDLRAVAHRLRTSGLIGSYFTGKNAPRKKSKFLRYLRVMQAIL